MKNEKILNWFQMYLTPAVLILLGIVLFFNPDMGSALIARVLGWGVMVVGIGYVIAALTLRNNLPAKIIAAIVCFAIGGWLLSNPLKLAAAIGRIVGILIAIRGAQDITHAVQWKQGMTYALATTAVGILLVVLPMTTSRLVMVGCGIVLVLFGGAMLLDRIKRDYRSGDSNIIDV